MTASVDPALVPTGGGAAALGRSVPRRGGRAPARSFDEARLVEELERRYDLGRWGSWRRTDEGKSNDSYFIDTDRGRYVLRRSSAVKTVPAAAFECALLDHLVAHGYPAPAVVRARDGACLVHLDGLVHMVMRRLEGAPYDAADPRGLALAGKGLGWYHRLVRDLPAEVTVQQVSTLAALRDGLARLSEVREVVGPVLSRETRTSLSGHLDNLTVEAEHVCGVFEDRAAELTYLVIHGSYGRTALLTDAAGLRGVVDFDRAVHDFLVLDLAYAVKSFGRPTRGTPGGALLDLDLAAELLRHYSAELPLAAADAELVPWALRLHRLAVVVKKCGNVLTKQAVQPREADDAEHFAALVGREADRLRWLAAHHGELAAPPSSSRHDSVPHPWVPPRQEKPMTNVLLDADARHVKAHQLDRANAVASPPFLDRYVRPLVGPGPQQSCDEWRTEVIQLDGSGAATVQVSLGDGAPVYAKLFPFDDGPEVHAKLARFRAAGFGDGARYQTVEPLAWVPEEKVLICRKAPGAPLSELLAGDVARLCDASAEAGRWLGHFHGSQTPVGQPQSLLVTGEVVSLAKRLAKVVAATPDYLDIAVGMLAQLDRLARNTVDGLLAQSHGQYRPIHVFLDGSTVTVIDLDRSGPADPARDCAEFLHHLRNGVHVATGDISRADGPCSAFLAGYREAGGEQRLANLQFHWARYLFHSLNRKVKDGEACHGGAADPVYERYRSEFDRVVGGRAVL